jgi:hypothetical protein
LQFAGTPLASPGLIAFDTELLSPQNRRNNAGGLRMKIAAYHALLLSVFAFAPTASAVDRTDCAGSFKVPFRPGSELHLDLRAGTIEILGSSESTVQVECELKDPGQAKNVSITFDDKGTFGRLRIQGGPNGDVRLRIRVPKESNLVVRGTAGDLDMTGVRGNKDVSLRAGDLTIDVGNPEDYAVAEASVTAGDVNASAFGINKGGLFRKFRRENPNGKYNLRASLWAGDIKLR